MRVQSGIQIQSIFHNSQMVRFKVRYIIFSIDRLKDTTDIDEKSVFNTIKDSILHCYGEVGSCIVLPSLIGNF